MAEFNPLALTSGAVTWSSSMDHGSKKLHTSKRVIATLKPMGQ